MSNDEWSKEWPSPIAEQTGITKELLGFPDRNDYQKHYEQAMLENAVPKPWPEAWVSNSFEAVKTNIIGIDVSTKPDTITVCIGEVKDGELIIHQFLSGDAALAKIKEYENDKPTHDPYTNPDMYLYHQCDCGAILDPNTKSFAQLNNAASYAGWKIRWGHDSYKAYCVECGKGVE